MLYVIFINTGILPETAKRKGEMGDGKMLLARNLKLLRRRHGYTQGQVALLLKVNRSTYAYYELGKTRPKIATLQALSNLYSVSIDDLLNKNFENLNV